MTVLRKSDFSVEKSLFLNIDLFQTKKINISLAFIRSKNTSWSKMV